MLEQKRVMLVEPEGLIASALCHVVASFDRFKVVAQVKDVHEALASIESYSIDIIISEVRLPGPTGIELIHELRRRDESVMIVMLSSIDSLEIVRQALLAGAQGYVFKAGTTDDLLAALNTGLSGRRFVPPQLGALRSLPENFYDIGDAAHKEDPLGPLTTREREVFHLLATGLSNNAIAKRLYISPRTVETHRARITRKLSLNTNGQLVRFALKHGLTSV